MALGRVPLIYLRGALRAWSTDLVILIFELPVWNDYTIEVAIVACITDHFFGC